MLLAVQSLGVNYERVEKAEKERDQLLATLLHFLGSDAQRQDALVWAAMQGLSAWSSV